MSPADLLNTFSNNLLPIVLISGVGFLMGKYLSVDPRSLGRVNFYFLIPVLVFNLLINNGLPLKEILVTMGFAIAVMITIGLIALAAGWIMHLDRPILMAALLTSICINAGNYGLPLVSFAFGKEALAHASMYFITNSILSNTLGVIIASMGHMKFKDAALGLFKVPTVYMVILAVFLNQLHIQLPLSIGRTINMIASGCIPLMLVLLGLELQRVRWSNSVRAIGLGTVMRLVLGPVVSLLLSIPFGLKGAARQGNVVESSMPTAVMTIVLATEYGLEPALVTATVFISTLLSPLTLTPLLVYLGR
jgi:hypothetical protein